MSISRRRMMGGVSRPNPTSGGIGYIRIFNDGGQVTSDKFSVKFYKNGTCNPRIEYCVRNTSSPPTSDSHWTVVLESEFNSLSIEAGAMNQSIFVRGYNPSGLSTSTSNFFYIYVSASGYAQQGVCVEGNIMYLVDCTQTLTTIPCSYCFYGLFSNEGGGASYNLHKASGLSFTVNGSGLKSYCYAKMFYKCNYLGSAPALPATTLVEGVYSQMFQNCEKLKIAPVLPANTLVTNCYANMFNNCKALKYIKCMSRTALGTSYTNNWVSNVPATTYDYNVGASVPGEFVKNSAATWTNTFGASAIPTGWTVTTASS